MNAEFDINKVITGFLSAKFDSAVDLLRSEAKGARDLVRSKFERTYRTYLERVLRRYSLGKSFFIRSEPTPLYSFFVPLNLRTQTRVISRASAGDLAEQFPFSIIIGSGGSGKTMLMRHLTIDTIKRCIRTPIFFELRQMNNTNDCLSEALLGVLKQNGLDVTPEYFELALQSGHFALLLDGFDELQQEIQERVSSEIQRLSERYPKNLVILSSRPDEKLQGWGDFTQFEVCSLDIEQAAELISKVPFEDPVKSRFVSDLRANLFDRHRSFLSNPLLLSIMLLTYRDAAHIPNKLSVFYSQAYESLFQRHDALKAGFQRQRRTVLDIQDFERVFAAFCLQSLERREFSFSQVRAIELLDSAKNLVHLSYASPAFLEDCIQATCLLLEEGLEITFAHRSFQEYFAARFISTVPETMKCRLIEHFTATWGADMVISLLHEIDAYSVEAYYILPGIQKLRQIIGVDKKVNDEQLLRYLQEYWSKFSTVLGGGVTLVIGRRNPQALVFAWRQDAGERKQDLKESADIVAEINRVANSGEVLTESLTPNDRLFCLIRDSNGLGGAEFVNRLIEIETEIRARHLDMNTSIQRILEDKSGAPPSNRSDKRSKSRRGTPRS